jgi:hypothetical protein
VNNVKAFYRMKRGTLLFDLANLYLPQELLELTGGVDAVRLAQLAQTLASFAAVIDRLDTFVQAMVPRPKAPSREDVAGWVRDNIPNATPALILKLEAAIADARKLSKERARKDDPDDWKEMIAILKAAGKEIAGYLSTFQPQAAPAPQPVLPQPMALAPVQPVAQVAPPQPMQIVPPPGNQDQGGGGNMG